jgi:HK97 family phage major capsid protein
MEFEEEITGGLETLNKNVAGYKAETQQEIKKLKDDLEKKSSDIKNMAEYLDKIKKDGGGLRMGRPSEKTAGDLINDGIQEHFESIKSLKKDKPVNFEIKAGNITISNVSSSGSAVNVPYSYDTGFVQRPHRKITIRDLVPVINSTTGTYVWFGQPITNFGSGSFGFQAGQGNIKAQVDKNLVQNIVNTDYLAGYARFSKQMLTDFSSLQSFLSADLVEDYRRAETGAFLPTLLAAATQFTPVPTTTVTAEKIVYAMADIASRDYTPTGIVCDAQSWGKLINTKPNSYGLPGGSAVTVGADGTINFLGLPIMISNNMPTGTVLVGDFTRAAIIQSEGLSIGFFDQDQDNVIRNLITARVEARVAFAVLRGDGFDFFGAGTT